LIQSKWLIKSDLVLIVLGEKNKHRSAGFEISTSGKEDNNIWCWSEYEL